MEQAHELADMLGIGYVVVDTGATSADLMEFADASFRLTRVASDGPSSCTARRSLRPSLAPPRPSNNRILLQSRRRLSHLG